MTKYVSYIFFEMVEISTGIHIIPYAFGGWNIDHFTILHFIHAIIAWNAAKQGIHSATSHLRHATLDLLDFLSVLHRAHLLDVVLVSKCSPRLDRRWVFSTVTARPSKFFNLFLPMTSHAPRACLAEKSPINWLAIMLRKTRWVFGDRLGRTL